MAAPHEQEMRLQDLASIPTCGIPFRYAIPFWTHGSLVTCQSCIPNLGVSITSSERSEACPERFSVNQRALNYFMVDLMMGKRNGIDEPDQEQDSRNDQSQIEIVECPKTFHPHPKRRASLDRNRGGDFASEPS
jgi:hypothetical protein